MSLLFVQGLIAQDFSYGFKAGLNFSTFSGDIETNTSGEEIETFKLSRGFHFGPIFNFKLTDVLGLRAEILYSQKGLDYAFEGQSYWIFHPTNGDDIYHIGGTRKTRMFVSNGYLDIPILAVARFGRVEVSLGANVAFLLSSKSIGEVTYSSSNIDPFTVSLDYNFRKDDVTSTPGDDSQIVSVSGKNIPLPKSVGAYYSSLGMDDKLYNSFDVGLNAGVSFYLSKGLFLGFRLNYGLLDTTKETQDISFKNLSINDSFIKKNDVDKNISLQASVGFSF